MNIKSIMKMEDILLVNMPSIVAIGFVYNRMFPVSIDSMNTRIVGRMKPIIERIRYVFFI